MNEISNFLAFFSGILLLIVLLVYIFYAVFLSKFNKLIYGKGSAIAFIPIFNVYLLGKLTINKIFGWILVFFSILVSNIAVTINGERIVLSVIPANIYPTVYNIYLAVVLFLTIIAIIKYFKLKNIQKKEAFTNNKDFMNQSLKQTVNNINNGSINYQKPNNIDSIPEIKEEKPEEKKNIDDSFFNNM